MSTVPHAPTGVTATAGDATATVTWDAPGSDGGSPLSGYTVTVYDNGKKVRTKTVGSGRSTTFAGLTDGDSYTFSVVATNAVGDSPGSAPSAAVTPQTVPDAPTGVTAVAGDTTVAVSWTAPDSDGGAAITGYSVLAFDGGELVGTTTVHAHDTSTTVSGLSDGHTYTFTVIATNGAGDSAPSAPSTAVTPVVAATVPDPPTAVTATAGDAVATVSWTAPASDGGATVTHYEVTVYDGHNVVTTRHVTASSTTTQLTGLTNGDSYTFTVTAVNSVGPSAPSDPSAAVSPASPPSTLGFAPAYGFDVPSGVVIVHVLKGAPSSIDPSSLQITSPPSHGSATANNDGTATYTADPGWTGTTTFTFTACTTDDSACGTQTATVYVIGQDQHWCDASGLDLSGANLAGVDFSHCLLNGANLSGANLDGATFSQSTLVNATFSGANLANATFDNDDVAGTVLTGATLTGMTAHGMYGGSGPTTSPLSLHTPKSTAVVANAMTSVSDTAVPVVPSSLAVLNGGASHGTVVAHSDGSITYTPKAGYTGTDRFTLSVANAFGFTSTILVTVTIPP